MPGRRTRMDRCRPTPRAHPTGSRSPSESLGTTAIADFADEFDFIAKGTSAIQQISGYPGPAAETLAQITATTAGGNKLGGLAYAVVNVKDGQALVVFSASKPPVLDKQGALPVAFAANADDLVLDPSEWTGAGCRRR